jgi:hypothetical protein
MRTARKIRCARRKDGMTTGLYVPEAALAEILRYQLKPYATAKNTMPTTTPTHHQRPKLGL